MIFETYCEKNVRKCLKGKVYNFDIEEKEKQIVVQVL